MRLIPAALDARLRAETTTLAHVWRVVRADGAAFAFTDHDQDLDFDGLRAPAASGLGGLEIEKSDGPAPDVAGAQGALNAAAIIAEDLAAGVWDGAELEVYRIDWTDPALRVRLFTGRLGEVRQQDGAFTVELRGLKAGLDRTIGRLYQRDCDAELGDARCGLDLSAAPLRVAATVAEALSARRFRAADLTAPQPDFLTGGRLLWRHGGETPIALHRDDVIDLAADPQIPLASGQSFTATPACDKAHATCRAKFANVANFRGFPHMPGPEAMLAPVRAGARNDGGSRWTP